MIALIVTAAIYLLIGAGYAWRTIQTEPPPGGAGFAVFAFLFLMIFWIPLLCIAVGMTLVPHR